MWVNAFLSLLIIYLMLVWRETGDFRAAYLALFILGLGLGNHRLIVMLAPAVGLFLLFELGRRFPILFWKPLFLMGLFGFAGSLVHVYLPIRALQGLVLPVGDPGSVDGFFRMVLFSVDEGIEFDFSLGLMLDRGGLLWHFTRYDFAIPALVISLLGAASLARHDRPFLAITLAPVLLTAFLIVNYRIHDIYYYFIPIFMMLAVWLGIGIAEVERLINVTLRRFTGAEARATASGIAVFVVRAVWLILPISLLIGNLSLLDRSGDFDAYDFSVNTLTNMAPGGAIMADHWTFYPIVYQQIVGGLRPDVVSSNILSQSEDELFDWIEQTLSEGRQIMVAEGLTNHVGEY